MRWIVGFLLVVLVAQNATAGPNADAVAALDIDGTNTTDDVNWNLNISAPGSRFAVEVYAKNLAGPVLGGNLQFAYSPKLKIVDAQVPPGLFVLSISEPFVSVGGVSPGVVLLGDGLFATGVTGLPRQ